MTFKDMKYELIINNVIPIFLEKGINAVTIKDVAESVGLGEATIYRYFSKKENIVLEVAIKIEERILNKYFNLSSFSTGFEGLNNFYNAFIEIYENQKEFYRFVSEFDSFVLNKGLPLNEYEKNIKSFYDVFLNAYNEGLKDNTVKEIDDINNFYFSTTHSLLGLCKKLSSTDILEQDNKLDKLKEIKTLKEIIMNYLKK
ncbi:TetR/AcrR family transcriptional regulator [bacterium]|nr:TetR/AcrR family transcriptional regulator [bacterium]